MACALVGKLDDAEHLRLERAADGVQQIGERPVARPLPGRPTRRPHPPQIGEICLNRRRQSCRRFRHWSSWPLRCLRSEFLKSLNPGLKMGKFRPDVFQSNPFSHLWAYRRLRVFIFRELVDDFL